MVDRKAHEERVEECARSYLRSMLSTEQYGRLECGIGRAAVGWDRKLDVVVYEMRLRKGFVAPFVFLDGALFPYPTVASRVKGVIRIRREWL